MLLYKIEDFNPSYREAAFNGEDIKGLDIYAGNTDEKIGSIDTALVDETGRFRYFVVDTGFWIFGKKVLVPVALCRVDVDAERIYATGLRSKDQAERLPTYEDGMVVDYDYEEQVRGVYRTLPVEASAPVEASLPLEASAPLSMPRSVSNQARAAAHDRNTYTYEQEPQLYQMNEREHHKFRLYEERLVAEKSRHKAGEVAISKRVETETARVSIPTEKERVVIESITPENAGAPVTRDTPFQQEKVMRMEVYEETAELKKEAFVREEVNIRKEVETEIVEATETLRREELDVKTEGR
ncbi:DUF2382 domain-containing protein [Microcoleus vaginatus ZQ-A3]|uniref:DUF2382 domain-containing protein n=1 Tax=Microcoleus vaginatus TaxID=119532 RepID=UPI001687BE41|nr:DUF2382 domain-containing protein [Microcoleus sp. FACHB-45]